MNTEYDYNFEPEIDETGNIDFTPMDYVRYYGGWLSLIVSLIGAVILLFWGCFKLAH